MVSNFGHSIYAEIKLGLLVKTSRKDFSTQFEVFLMVQLIFVRRSEQ